MPKNHTVLYQAVGDKVRVIVDGVDANGKPTHTEWNGKFDGEDYPVIGDPMSDTRAYKKIDDRTLEMTLKKADSVVATVRIVIAADGKSRTVSVSVKNPAGKTIEETAVYDRQ